MSIRKIIREIISRVMDEAEQDVVGGALDDIGAQLDADLQNVNDIVKTQQTDIKDFDNRLKAKLQLKGKLSPTTPERKGLEREIPVAQQDYEKRKLQLKDLENARTGIQAAHAEIEKQKQELQKQATITSQVSGKQNGSGSVLPSLESPI